MIQGEEQKKLDVLSNEVFIKALTSSGRTVSLRSRSYLLTASERTPPGHTRNKLTRSRE